MHNLDGLVLLGLFMIGLFVAGFILGFNVKIIKVMFVDKKLDKEE